MGSSHAKEFENLHYDQELGMRQVADKASARAFGIVRGCKSCSLKKHLVSKKFCFSAFHIAFSLKKPTFALQILAQKGHLAIAHDA